MANQKRRGFNKSAAKAIPLAGQTLVRTVSTPGKKKAVKCAPKYARVTSKTLKLPLIVPPLFPGGFLTTIYGIIH